MTPEQALLRVRNASRVSGALCRGLADHVFSLRLKDPGLMTRWGQVADAAAEKTADQLAAGLARAHFGNALRVSGDLEGATKALDRAEELLPTAHPLIHEFRASLFSARRDFTGAMSELRRAEDMRTALKDRLGLAKVLIQTGIVCDYLKQPGEAVELLEKAIEVLTHCGEEGREFLVIALHNLADYLISAGQLAKARELLNVIEDPLAATGHMNALKLTWVRGRLASYAGKDKEARTYYEAARAGYRELDMRREVALISLHLAALHYQHGRVATSVREALKVKPELEALDLDQNAQVTDLLGQIATRSGHQERAILTLTSLVAESRQKRTNGT
jgi:tetratricopeptide (TPR) repeat protein